MSNNSTDRRDRRWTSRSIGSGFQHRIFYTLIRLGGWRLAYFILYFVVSHYVLFRPSVRKRTEYYLSHRFPEAKALKRILNSYRLSLELGKVLIDRAIIGIQGIEKIHVTFKKRDEFKKTVREGHGIILLMAHIGCWQVALSVLHFLKIPVNLLLHQEEGDVDIQYFEHADLPRPYRIIDPEGYLGGTLEMIEVLKNGEALCIMGDRLSGNKKNAVSVPFLGEKVLFPFSAMKIASASGAPVVVLFPVKTDATNYELELAKIIQVPKNLGRSGDQFLPYVTLFVEAMESFVMEHPFQFFNFYDMWESNVQ